MNKLKSEIHKELIEIKRAFRNAEKIKKGKIKGRLVEELFKEVK